jgi:uncharacterized protein YecE (DUF72 family)
MGRYWEKFDIVELNQPFYDLPKKETAMKWREEAPKNAEFVVKAWQLITHPANSSTYNKLKKPLPEAKKRYYGMFRNTDEVMEAWKSTLELARILRSKIILFQTPGSFVPNLDNLTNMTKFFKNVKRESTTFAWEPRGKWDKELIIRVCTDLNLIHAVDPLRQKQLYGHVSYFRLHGTYSENRLVYDYSYSRDELKKLIGMCDKQTGYVFFNNSDMLNNAVLFQKLVQNKYNL